MAWNLAAPLADYSAAVDTVKQIPANAGNNVYWYWGHEHAGAVYAPQHINAISVYQRCCGHGCIPWGLATELTQSGNVLWCEKQILGPAANYFVTNGYATLTLNGPSLTECFWNQDGQKSWFGPTGPTSGASSLEAGL